MLSKLSCRLTAVVLSFALASTASAANVSEEVEVKAEKVGDGLYMLSARGGNIGAVIGADGTFLVDDQYAPLTPLLRAKLDELAGGKAEVRFVLNTHVHGDHTGGNENLGAAGALIVAHENVRRRMSTDAFRREFLEAGGGKLDDALPVVTFSDRVTFHVNGRTLETVHYPRAHTDGDSVVWFREDNAVHMGDLYFQVGYPFIDLERGGSVDGYIAAVADVLACTDEDTVIMPGHGVLSDRDELAEYHAMLTTLRDAVAKQLAAGRNLEEVLAMALTRDFDARWSWRFIDGERFVETLYTDLSRKR